MLNKIVLFLLSLSCFISLKGQNSLGVWGKIQSGSHLTLVYFEFDTSNCKRVYRSAVGVNDDTFFIIGDSACPKNSKNRYYVVFFRQSMGFVPIEAFQDTFKLNDTLKIIDSLFPQVVNRFQKVSEQSTRMKEAENKRLEDSSKILLREYEKVLSNCAAKNIVVYNWSWNYPNEYSSFVNVDIKIINPYKKRIKYAWVSFYAKNAVGDPVKDRITNSPNKTVRAIGPIDPKETGSYTFENVYYSKVIESLKIIQIKIQFFDGSIKLIDKPISLDIDE